MKVSIDVAGSLAGAVRSHAPRSFQLQLWRWLLCLAALSASSAWLSAANLLAPGLQIIGVAATPGSSSSAVAVSGTTAGANNYPAAESPPNAIDASTGTKYLNFAKINCGFIVTIPGGSSTVTGFQFTTANDATDRDPITVTIEGSAAPDPTTAASGTTWTTIYTGPSGLATDPGRFGLGAPISFVNAATFTTYRMLITDVRNQAAANSMQFSEIQFFGTVADVTPPVVANVIPAKGAIVQNFTQVEVVFSEPVTGVDASDLLINNVPATDITFGSPNQFVFKFPQPATGAVSIAFAPGHGIRDLAAVPNAFAGDSWTNILDPNVSFAGVRINEFLADNGTGIRDEDGDREDWIELFNGSAASVNLGGWFLTDNPANLTQWRFPSGVQMAPNSYLLIWASSKNRTNAAAPLHTNFKLEKTGEFLALILPDSNTVVSAFQPAFPPQQTDASYGRDRLDPNIVGFFSTPTPTNANAVSGQGFAPDVKYSVDSGMFVSPFTLTLSTKSSNAVIRYVLITNASGASMSLTNVPTTNSPIYTGPIPIGLTTEVRARAFQTGLLPGTPVTKNYVLVNNEVRNFNSDIPVVLVHVLGAGSIPQSGVGGIFMAFETNVTGRTSLSNAPQVATRMTTHIRGSSTLNQAKSNLRIELWDEFNQDKDYPMLGMPSESDWVLLGLNGFDPPLMHNAIYQWLGKQLGVPYMKWRYVEVFRKIDGGAVTLNDYFGLYLLLETPKVNGKRLDIARLDPQDTNTTAITGGYLMKIDRVDTERSFSPPVINGLRTTPAPIAFVDPQLQSNESDPRRLAQINYFQGYINQFLTNLTSLDYTNPVTGYAQYINVDQWMNHLLANIIPFNVDGYRLSGFFYKDRGGRLEQGPMWDCDRCLGTGGSSGVPQGDNRCFSPRFWRLPAFDVGTDNGTDFFGVSNVGVSWFSRLFRDPDFWQKFIDRYQQVRTNEYSVATVTAQIDAFHREIKEAQVREQARWAPSGFTFPRSGVQTVQGYSFNFGPADNFGRGRYSNEVNFQKQWLIDRFTFMDTNFLDMPTLSAGSAMVPGGSMFTATPAAKAGSILLYTLNGTDPRAPGGGVSPSALMSAGPLTITVTNNVRLFARSYNTSHANLTNSGTEVGKPLINSFWSGPAAATYYTTIPTLRITELMYHPANPPAGNTNNPDNFEFIELKNIGATTLNLAGFTLSGGIWFTFPTFTLNAGQYCVVVKNTNSFVSRYGTGPAVVGAFQGNLANDGDHVVLRGPLQEPIQDFVYSDKWYPLTDDHGFSLVMVDETATSNLSTNTAWRRSNVDGGSPGQPNPAIVPVTNIVLVNEALTHTDPPLLDTVELYNPGNSPADISGWFLSDSYSRPKKYEFPAGTIVQPRSYFLLNESSFNVGSNAFALGSNGDDIYLFSGGGGFLTGYYHGFSFGASENGRTFGRYVNSQGEEHFVAQATNSLGATNGLPLVGPIVISEVMYHPPDAAGEFGLVDNSEDEFVELYNITTTNVPLYHVLYPSNTWRLTSAVDFSFPTNVSIAPTSRVLVVSFDPAVGGAAFRAKYGVPANVPIYGPYDGKLDNSSESVRLRRPDSPNGPEVPYILVDRLDYKDKAPWPISADGFGASLQRLALGAYGNDPTNWAAARATPGLRIDGGAPPVITQQPVNITIIEGMNTNLSVAVSSPTPVAYQWQQNSNSVPGATAPVLAFTNIQPSASGFYTVSVFNGGGSVFSTPVFVNVRRIPVITLQPQSQNVMTNSTFSLSVAATGTGPLRYQWRFNEMNIPGATNTTLTYSNAELFAHSGEYDVVITDDVGPRFSEKATIIVLARPFYLINPVSQSVVQGQNVRVSVVAGPQHPLLPLTYRWIVAGAPVTTNLTGTFTLTNIQPPNKTVRVAVTNLATGPGGVNSSTATLTVLADFDGDGMADVWEIQYGGFNTNDASDGVLDFDGDGMSNRDEYLAGTDPTDPLSVLKVLTVATNPAVLQFVAQSNLTYSVQYRTNFAAADWLTLTNFGAQSDVRTVEVNNIIAPLPPERYFRIVTPIIP